MLKFSIILENYEQALDVFNKLSEEEKMFLTHDGTYKKSPRILYTYVKVINNDPVGFVDVYLNNNDGKITGFLILAVIPKARGTGLGKELIYRAINGCRKKNVSMIIYKVHRNNIPSRKLIESCGYKITRYQEDYYIYELNL